MVFQITAAFGEQTQATGLVHDFVDVGIPEFTTVGEEQPFGQRMPMFATVQLQLDAASKRFFVDVPQNIYGFDDPAIGSFSRRARSHEMLEDPERATAITALTL